jgi:hypothetical protein
MSIQIEGLSRRQRALADVLWMINGRDEVDSFIRALHPTMRADAEVVIEMMTLAVFDQIDTVDESVKIMLDNLK